MGLYRLYGVFLRHLTCKDPLKSSNFPCAPLHVTSLMVQSVYNCIIELLQMHYKPRFISPNMANLNAFFLWGLSSLMRRTLALGQCCRTKPKSQCLYIRKVSSQHLLSALHNWFKLVCGQFGQSNMNHTLNFCPRPAIKDLNVPYTRRPNFWSGGLFMK